MANDDFRADAWERQHAPSAPGEPRLVLHRGDDVQPVAVDWLWPGWLAAGKLHLIGGAPGTGKTTLALAMAATVSRGGTWPDGLRAAVGDVLVWSGEDDIADTLVPRLRLAGAAMDRVHIIGGVVDKDGRYPFDPARDLQLLRDALHMIPARLLVVDPIVSAVSGDSHKNAEVRRGLMPLVDLAATHGCAVTGVTHFSKGTNGRDPLERITGSLAFGALARVVMVVAKCEASTTNVEDRVLLRAKSNIGMDGGGFKYQLVQCAVEGFPDVIASRAVFGESITGDTRELLAQAERIPEKTFGPASFLRDALSRGARPVNELLAEAFAAGFSEDTMNRAKVKLQATSVKLGMKDGWAWWLPGTPSIEEREEREHRARCVLREGREGREDREGSEDREGVEGGAFHERHLEARRPTVGEGCKRRRRHLRRLRCLRRGASARAQDRGGIPKKGASARQPAAPCPYKYFQRFSDLNRTPLDRFRRV